MPAPQRRLTRTLYDMRTSITLILLALFWAFAAQAEDGKAGADSAEVVINCAEWDTQFAYKLESGSGVVFVVHKKPPRYEPVANNYLEKRGYKILQRCPDSAEEIRENEDEVMERSMKAEVVDTLG